MRQRVFVDEQDAFHGAAHSNFLVLVLHALEARLYRMVPLRLGVLRAECVVRQGVPKSILALRRHSERAYRLTVLLTSWLVFFDDGLYCTADSALPFVEGLPEPGQPVLVVISAC